MKRSSDGLPRYLCQLFDFMGDITPIDHEQFRRLLDKGHKPEEAAHIVLQSKRLIWDTCQEVLEKLSTQEGKDSLHKMLDELEATDGNKG